MRILLTANASYAPPRGGATRSNLIWLDRLAESGHQCRIVCATAGEGAPLARHETIEIITVADPAHRAQTLRRQIIEWRPDWVLVSSEDLGHALLHEAHHAAPGRVVYLAHTPQFFPFGPASWNLDAHAAEMVAGCAGVIAIGHHMAEYIERELGRACTVIHPPIYGPGPFPALGNFERGLITMINPCAVKGISIFLEVAARLPAYEFGVVPGWGTTAEDRRALARLPNVRTLPNAKNIEDILAGTRVLLVPSLWYEGFGLIVMEAMLRGIPVVASDSGGLREAKRGTAYVIPVRTVERYLPVFDEHAMPKPELPENDCGPWVRALETLFTDRDAYQRESAASRAAALHFAGSLNPRAMETYLSVLHPLLRILLAQNSRYFPAHGGGDKSNRLLMETLAARGHICRVVARTSGFGAADKESYLAELADRGVTAQSADGVVTFQRAGVDVRVVANANLKTYFASQLEAFQPEIVIASTDDPAQLLLDAALRSSARVVYLARATIAVPFGPDCAFPSEPRTARLREADAVIGVSRYVADYVRRHANIDAVHVPISLMEPGEFPALGRFENEFVTMVNPCAVKGIAIFLALADAFPKTAFAAAPLWGTNALDRAALAERPNVTLLDPVDNIDELLARTRILLMPSLWAEARSRMAVEAMLRGVPVISSNQGGLPEAKLGVPYLLPVNPIAKYHARVDDQMVPEAEVPVQDITPWREALARLLSDRAHYEELSRASRSAAIAYAGALTIEPFERLLIEMLQRPKRAGQTASAPAGPLLDRLSPEKRQLLALRLRKRASSSAWFPGADAITQSRLFWFPHAGGGAGQVESLPGIGICAVRLPGREARIAEAPFERMGALIPALADAIEPYLAQPFAFFGHSMGAVVAFELARELRRRALPLPRMLIASAARAPQYRRNHRAPAPEEWIGDLPALRADAALYGNYIYPEGAALPCAIRAYGGLEDPGIRREHLEAWAEQTTCSFALRLFPGGHFYMQSSGAAFRAALTEDLEGAQL